MKVLVVEEEQQILKKLERVLKKMDDTIRIIGTVPSIFSSAAWLHQHGTPDIILVNKDLLRNKKMSRLPAHGIKATVIFTLQSDQFTFQAFRINNLKHLLAGEMAETIGDTAAVEAAPLPWQPVKTGYRNRFLVKQGQRFASVETPDIAYFFSDGRLWRRRHLQPGYAKRRYAGGLRRPHFYQLQHRFRYRRHSPRCAVAHWRWGGRYLAG